MISLGIHMLVLGGMIFNPQWRPKRDFMPSVIDVRMVDLTERAASAASKAPSTRKAAPPATPPKPAETKAVAPQPASTAKPEISTAPRRKTTKTALKYKTFKTEAMKRKALEQLKQKMETGTPRPLQDRFKELREKVAKEGKPTQEEAVAEKGPRIGTGTGVAQGSQKEIELIDLYRLEIAYSINKNWAYVEQLSGRSDKQMAVLAFKVLPDGKITDIFFTDRSGDPNLDDSAYKAIIKSSPVKPHPAELKRDYIEMGLRFTPEGVQ